MKEIICDLCEDRFVVENNSTRCPGCEQIIEKENKSKVHTINGKEIDDEGYYKVVEFWTKEDGSIKMNLADGFSKANLKQLLKIAIKEVGNNGEKN